MNYPSLSLKQDLIDEVFSKKKKELNQTASAGSIRLKKYYKEQKELRLQNVVVEECDQCDYKTTRFQGMYKHKREKHSVVKQRCSDCEYSHVYPNRVKMHYNLVHMGMKRARGCNAKCRRESCEFVGTTNCLELETHLLFFCQQCQLSFGRSDSLKFHNDKIHEGLVFNCEYCDTYSTARKDRLERHMLSKHSDEDFKQIRKPRFCKEEGCTYRDFNGQLKLHIEKKHEGIVRFKCHVMNCGFGTSWSRDLRRHTRTHEKESSKVSVKSEGKLHKNPSVACDQENCNAKAENVRELKTHIAETHRGAIKHICQVENCNFETYWKSSLLKHTRRCKHRDSKSAATTESVSVDTKTSSKEEGEIEHVSGTSQKRLCNIPGCDFISSGEKETEIQNHFRIKHCTDSELTENSFIVINSAMAEAMEILQEIQEIKKKN